MEEAADAEHPGDARRERDRGAARDVAVRGDGECRSQWQGEEERDLM